MDSAEHERNLSNCRDGIGTCDTAQLTQSEANEVAIDNHQRNAILHGSSSENLAMRVAHPTRPAAYGPSSKTQACVNHKLVPKGGRPVTSSMPRWALSVAERRLIWLVKKHPKMDRHRLGLWTFLGNQYE